MKQPTGYKNPDNLTCIDLILTNVPPEAVVQRCSVKKVFLEISQNSQENTQTSHTSYISYISYIWNSSGKNHIFGTYLSVIHIIHIFCLELSSTNL